MSHQSHPLNLIILTIFRKGYKLHADVLMGTAIIPIRTSAIQSRSRPDAISGLFQPYQEVKTACSTISLKLTANGLQHVLENWVERCKKCIACQGRYFEKRPSPHLQKVPTWSPRTLQSALVKSPQTRSKFVTRKSTVR
jgi:hypothetical protein